MRSRESGIGSRESGVGCRVSGVGCRVSGVDVDLDVGWAVNYRDTISKG
ncbi:MAG: hypothetical protein F6K26_40195 [Moorea sp. SIO2I5]|nr:hypothetical protein [Moorena sp. SIO2I5]